MARPRCDPFDIAAVRAAIDKGSPERAEYAAYASRAARPYARSTFSTMLRADRAKPLALAPSLPSQGPEGDAADAHWRERGPVKPRILSLSPGGGLRVQAGSLVAFDRERSLVYSPSAKPPAAIVLSSAGGFVSIEAVRFCVRAGVAIVALNRAHGFLSILTGPGSANAKLLRAQVASPPGAIARSIVAAKLASMAQAGALRSEAAARHAAALDRARTFGRDTHLRSASLALGLGDDAGAPMEDRPGSGRHARAMAHADAP